MLRIVSVLLIVLCCAQSSYGQDHDWLLPTRTEPKKGKSLDELKALAEGKSAKHWQRVLNDKKQPRTNRLQAAQALYFHGDDGDTIFTLIGQLWEKDGLVGWYSIQTVVFLCPRDQKCLNILLRLLDWNMAKKVNFSDIYMSKIFLAIEKYGVKARPYFSKFLPYFNRRVDFVDFPAFIEKIGIEKKNIEPLFEMVKTTKGSVSFEKSIAALGKDCIPAVRKHWLSKDERQRYLASRVVGLLTKEQPKLALTLFPEFIEFAKKEKAGEWIGRSLVEIGEIARVRVEPLIKSSNEIEVLIALEYYAGVGCKTEAEKAFIETELKSKRHERKLKALRALVKTEKDKKALVKRLIQFVKGKDLFIMIEALNTLIRLKVESGLCIPVVKPLLSHEEAMVRSAAASILGQFGVAAKHCLPALKVLLDDDDFNVADDADAAIEKIEKALKKAAKEKNSKKD